MKLRDKLEELMEADILVNVSTTEINYNCKITAVEDDFAIFVPQSNDVVAFDMKSEIIPFDKIVSLAEIEDEDNNREE